VLPGSLLRRFDWHLPPPQSRFPGRRRGRDPRSVFAAPEALQQLLDAARDMDGRRRDRVAVFGGTEVSLSAAFGRGAAERAAKVKLLRRWFDTVFFYVKDAEVEGVRTMPHGLMHFHLSHKGQSSRASKAITAARVDAATPRRGALAAWGGTNGTHLERAHELTGRAGREPEAAERDWRAVFARLGVAVPDRELSAVAWEDRAQAQKWCETPEAADAGVELRSIAHKAYWETLSQYRFSLCPMGSGIQSNKMFEALLVLTVPIVRRVEPYAAAYDDLVRMGFPIVVVAEWSEITAERLDAWWAAVAPRLPRFRSRCLTAEGFWRLFTSANHSCL